MQNFLHAQGIRTFADKYSLDGKPESDRHSVGMLAGAAVGSLASTPGPVSDAFLKELWETPVPVGELNGAQLAGKAVFNARCAQCHYDRTDGAKAGPSLLAVFQKPALHSGAAATDERVTATVGRGGLPGIEAVLKIFHERLALKTLSERDRTLLGQRGDHALTAYMSRPTKPAAGT